MPFAPFDFLMSIKADVLPLRRHLDTLAGGTAGRRFGQAALALPFPLAQGVHDAPPHPRLPPAAKIAIDCVGIADICGHHAPLAPDFVDVEIAIEDATEVYGLPPWSTRAPLGWGQQQLEGFLLRIAHICGLVTCGAHRRYFLPGCMFGRSVTP